MRALCFEASEEPLVPWLGPERPREDDPGGVREVTFEFASRGDRVPGRLLLPPERTGPRPLVLVGHGLNGAKDAGYMDVACLPWARGGAAVASIDFPLHGERRSPKLSERILERGLTGAPGSLDAALWIDLVEQAVVDLRRGLRAAAVHPEVDGSRVGYAGFSLGTLLGTLFCAEEPRVAAAALALGGAGLGPPEVDPEDAVARIAPRPVLFVNAERDERVPRASAERLHAAAGSPNDVQWFDATHDTLPGAALKAMWSFLRGHLGA
jgi:dienelactone hydrolase